MNQKSGANPFLNLDFSNLKGDIRKERRSTCFSNRDFFNKMPIKVNYGDPNQKKTMVNDLATSLRGRNKSYMKHDNLRRVGYLTQASELHKSQEEEISPVDLKQYESSSEASKKSEDDKPKKQQRRITIVAENQKEEFDIERFRKESAMYLASYANILSVDANVSEFMITGVANQPQPAIS